MKEKCTLACRKWIQIWFESHCKRNRCWMKSVTMCCLKTINEHLLMPTLICQHTQSLCFCVELTKVSTYTLFFRRALPEVLKDGRSWESSGRASASGLMSPTTGVAFLRACATCCSRASLIALISTDGKRDKQTWDRDRYAGRTKNKSNFLITQSSRCKYLCTHSLKFTHVLWAVVQMWVTEVWSQFLILLAISCSLANSIKRNKRK